jgi:C4-dicarboxylate transporter, DctM subunit
MSSDLSAIIGFASLVAMVVARVPIGFSMAIAGIGGSALIIGIEPALSILANSPLRTATSYIFGLVPLFILMGTIASASGMSRELFEVGNA